MNNKLKSLIKKTPLLKAYRVMRKGWEGWKEKRKYTTPTSSSLPIQLFIEITNHCMLKCIMCSRERAKRGVGFMDFRLYKKVIDEISQWPKSPTVMLVFAGEPLAHSEFIKFARYAADKNVMVNTVSNGYILTPQLSEEILNSGLERITFSLDATTKEIYDQIRIGSNWDRVIGNVNYLLNLRKKKNLKKPYIQVSFVIQDKNKHQVKKFINEWIDKVDTVYFQREFTERPDITGQYLVTRGEFNLDAEERKPCYYLWNSMAVYWNGDVTTCAADVFGKNIMGNVNKDSLTNIWKNDNYQRLRKFHINKQYGNEKYQYFCKNCDYWRGYRLNQKSYLTIKGIKVLKEENPLFITYTPH